MFYFYKKHRLLIFVSALLGLLFTQKSFPMATPEQHHLVCKAPYIPLLHPKTSFNRPLTDDCYNDYKIEGRAFYQICQLFYGEEISINSEEDYFFISGPNEKGGCIPKEFIQMLSDKSNSGEQKAIVTEPLVQTYFPDKTECTLILPMGSILHLRESNDDEFFQFLDNHLNEEKNLLIRKKNIKLFEELKAADEDTLRSMIVMQAKKFIERPYQWGGQTAIGIDCSGLIYTVYTSSGQAISRNILHLFNERKLIEPSKIKPGDIIFFYRNGYRGGIADHVAIYEGDDVIIESSPQAKKVIQTTFEQEYGKSLASCDGNEKFSLYGETYRIGCQSIITK